MHEMHAVFLCHLKFSNISTVFVCNSYEGVIIFNNTMKIPTNFHINRPIHVTRQNTFFHMPKQM